MSKSRMTTIAMLMVLLTACTSATPEPTAVPTSLPEPTSPPAPPTAPPTDVPAPPAGLQPLNEADCTALADIVSQAVGIPATTGQAPFEDYVAGETGTGCQVTAAGSDLDFADVNSNINNLTAALQNAGWQDDLRYGGGGAGGWIAGYRRADSLCLFIFSSEPADPSQCGDEPFVACWERLPPEQRLRNFDFNCVQGASEAPLPEMPTPPTEQPPPMPPTPTVMPAATLLPLDAGECQALADLMSGAVGLPATASESVFSDFRTGASGASCLVLASGNETNVADYGASTDALLAAMKAASWQEDPRYGAGGAGGWVTGYRRDDMFCQIVFSSEPADPSVCGDEPFAVCWERIPPEQRLRNFEFNCVHDPVASVLPTAVVLEDGTQCAFTGAGATLAFDNLRLNYDCGLSGENQIGILGALFPDQDGSWLGLVATIGQGTDGFYLIQSELSAVYTAQ